MRFENEYSFLSNFYTTPIQVNINGKELLFRNTEAAFQAHKNKSLSDKFCLLSGYNAKKYGRQIPLDVSLDQWNNNDRYYVMAKVLWIKFQNETLFKLLQNVKEPIIEDNYWNDTFWGVCINKKYDHVGKNVLGQLLTCIKENGNGEDGLKALYKLCEELKEKYREIV